MAVLTAQGISDVAVELLTRTLVLPNTVTRIPGSDFSGDNGDTITVRVPQPGTARIQASRGSDITFDDTYEVPVDVSMTHLYHGKLLTDEEMTFDIKRFASQITRVQVAAVATGAEDQLAAVMNALLADDDTVSPDGTNVRDAVLGARAFLGKNDAPAGGRWLAVSPDFATALLSDEVMVKVNESGSESALRSAVIGRIFGFTVVESNGLTAGTAVAYHESGFAWANRTAGAPRGAKDSAMTSSGGVSLRQIFDYIPTKLSDTSILSTFAGAAAVYDWDFDVSGDPESGDVAKRFYKLELGS